MIKVALPLALSLVAVACTDSSSSPNAQAARHGSVMGPSSSTVPRTTTPEIQPTPAIEALLARLAASTSPDVAAGLRHRLLDPSVRVISIRGDARLKNLADSVLLLRDQVVSAAAGTRFAAAFDGKVISSPVVLALVERLQEPGAVALIIRRPNASPHDIVLLQTQATSTELGSALKVLKSLRQKDGEVPTRNEMVAVRSKDTPAAWKTDGTDARADDLLNSLRGAPAQQYDGIGTARAFTISVGRHAAGK